VTKRPSSAAHAATGIISLALLLATIPVLPPIPPFGSSETEIVTFYSTYTTRGYLYQFIAGLALLAALWFLGYLYTRFRRAAPESPLPIIMVASGTAWVAFAIVYLGLFQIFSIWAGQPEARPILRAFSDAYVLGFMFSVFPAAVMVAAASWCTQRSAGWPGWLRPLGIVALAVQVLGSVTLIFPTGPLRPGGLITYGSVFAIVFWICMASVAATRSERAGGGHDQEAFSDVRAP
jgi:hypothetical protein